MRVAEVSEAPSYAADEVRVGNFPPPEFSPYHAREIIKSFRYRRHHAHDGCLHLPCFSPRQPKPSNFREQARLRVWVGQQRQMTRRAPVLKEQQFFCRPWEIKHVSEHHHRDVVFLLARRQR